MVTVHLYPDGFYYHAHKSQHISIIVSTSAENGTAMAGPARPVSKESVTSITVS